MKAKLALFTLAAVVLAGCSASTPTSSAIQSRSSLSWDNPYAGIADETVTLTVWAGETDESVEYIKDVAKAFKDANPRSNYTIQVKPVSESSVSGDWAKDATTAAHVAIAADDQIPTMISAGYLQNLEGFDRVIEGLSANVKARVTADSLEAVTFNDKTYALPISSSNGFVFLYNSALLGAEDVTSFDKMLAKIHELSERDGKTYRFGFPSTSGWYLDGWFHAAGFNVHGDADSKPNECDWNATVDGVEGKDVAGAMVKLAQGQYKSHWVSDSANLIMSQTGEGPSQVIATITGTWNYNRLAKSWNGNVGAAVLPTFHLDRANKDVRMQCPKGYKVAVINKNKGRDMIPAAKFAEFLANYQSQIWRFDSVTEIPCHKDALEQVDIQSNPVTKAITEQYAAGAFAEKVNPYFWGPSNGLSDQLLNGSTVTGQTNLVSSGVGTAEIVLNYDAIQAALDECVNSLANPA